MVVLGQLAHNVKKPEKTRRGAGFGFLDRDPQAAARFNGAMVELTRLVAKDLVRAYDFTGLKRVLDVGGGCGTLLAAILDAYAGPARHSARDAACRRSCKTASGGERRVRSLRSGHRQLLRCDPTGRGRLCPQAHHSRLG
jgi:hypothetical protein